MKKLFSRFVAFTAGIFIAVSTFAQTADLTPKSVLDAMQRVGDWQLAHPETNRPTGWICAVGDIGMMALAGISGDAKYRDAMFAKGETNGWRLPTYGGRKYHADDQAFGQVCAEMYFDYRENKMLAPMREKFDWILTHPSAATNLDFTIKPHAQELWTWCDALFMAPPAWLRLYYATGDARYLDFAVTNFWRTTDLLYDKDEHLFFRDSTFFKKTEANGKKVFWSRGNGWVLAGLVRTLQYLPSNHPERTRFEQLFKDMAEKIVSLQQPDGMWRASLLDPENYPTPEASGTALFTYGLAWGVNQGLLDRAKYEPAVRKAWPALVACVNADGRLTHVQPAGDRPVKFDANATSPYGGGVFLLAGSEVYRMAVLSLPLFDSKKNSDSETVFPVVLFTEANSLLAINDLARVAGLKCEFDSKLNLNNVDSATVTNWKSTISARWTQVPAHSALEMTMENCGLKMIQEDNTNIYNIVVGNLHEHFVSSPIAVNVTNPAKFYRESETVEVSYRDFLPHSPESTNDLFPFDFVVIDGASSRILDSQVYSEDSTPKLLFQADFAPNETKTFYILDASALAATPTTIVKTMARYVPERFDDFAWESDRIAHRIYGQALIKAEGTISSGADVWIKKDRGLIVDTMYATKHYHADNGSFMDDYRVGKSRGCGGLGIWDGKALHVSSNWKNWKLITTGPIRSEFEMTYDAWDAGNGRMVSEVKRFSIDAGSWLTKVTSTISSEDKSSLSIGIGLAERACPTNREEFIEKDLTEGWMTYWQPEDQPKGTTAVAILLPKGSVKEFTNDDPTMPDSKKHANVPQPTHEGYPPIRTQLAVTQFAVGQPFSYYFGACWDRSGDFTNHVQWENYLKDFAARRDQPLQVTVGN